MSADVAEPENLTVTLVWSPGPRVINSVVLQLPRGSTAQAALAASGTDVDRNSRLGVWGRKVAPDHVLHDGDRLEVYRPLKVDPKRARRERFSRQGARTAGLFAKRSAPDRDSG